MSNFQTLSLVTGGTPGTAARIYSAVTTDALAKVLATGYVSDLAADGQVKTDDVLFIRHDDGTVDAGIAQFKVLADGASLGYMTDPSGNIPLPNTQILVGNAGGVAAPVAMSGDATISNTGVLTIGTGAITSPKLATPCVNTNNVIDSAITTPLVANSNITYPKIQAVNGLSLLGRGASSGGQVGEITASSPGQIPVYGASGSVAFSQAITQSYGDATITLAKLAAGIAPAAILVGNERFTTVGGAATEAFTVAGALTTDNVLVFRRVAGAVPVSVENAIVSGANTVTVTFSADPANDTQIAIFVVRDAA